MFFFKMNENFYIFIFKKFLFNFVLCILLINILNNDLFCKDYLDYYINPKFYYISIENYDRHVYYNFEIFNFIYTNTYSLDWNKFSYSFFYNFIYAKYSYNFYIYKYIYFLEDTNFNYKVFSLDSYIKYLFPGKYFYNFSFYSPKNTFFNNAHPYSLNIYSIREYVDYLKNILISKDLISIKDSYKESIFGSQLVLNVLLSKDYLSVSYIIFYFIFFILFYCFFYFIVFFIFFIFVFNFYLSYKFYFLGFYLKILVLAEDDGDDYVGRMKGYVDFMVDDESLEVDETYYNIVKYEFNYLNYLLFTKFFISNWVFSYFNNFNFYFYGIGQTKLIKFINFSIIITKLELSFFSFLVQEDGESAEWRYFPYEHIDIAFPESDFYKNEVLFNSVYDGDYAYDFDPKKYKKIPVLLHPYSVNYVTSSEYEYDENFNDIEEFLNNFKNSEKILSTYVLRFKKLFLRYLEITAYKEEVFYTKSKDSYNELLSRLIDLDVQFLHFNSLESENSLSFRYEYDKNNLDLLYSNFKVDENPDNKNVLEDYIANTENDINYGYKLELNKNFENNKMIEDYIFQKYNSAFSYYVKYNGGLLIRNFSFINFFSYLIFDPVFQFFLRSKNVWSSISSSEENSLEIEPVEFSLTTYIYDKNLYKNFFYVFNSLNFNEFFFLIELI
jgi:hypothetical protein